MTDELKPCPFCGIRPIIQICDEEGNYRNEDYLNDPWSGISYQIRHCGQDVEDADCPILMEDGPYLYNKREDAVNAWNKRYTDV